MDTKHPALDINNLEIKFQKSVNTHSITQGKENNCSGQRDFGYWTDQLQKKKKYVSLSLTVCVF